MKYVITGGAGHISKPLATSLLANGHDVTVIGRNADHLRSLIDKGAKTAIGTVEDLSFLKEVFEGAEAVYTMIPPIFETNDLKAHIARIGRNYAEALKNSGVRHVVNLSSVGADLEEGCGPVTGLHWAEEALNQLTDLRILHLRPGYFYSNFYGNIPMIRDMSIIGGNLGDANHVLILSSTDDIAEAATEALLRLDFKGHTVRYVPSDERTTGEVAKVLGAAVGKAELPWVEFTDEQMLTGLRQAGLAEEIAKNYTEMGAAIRSGVMWQDFFENKPTRWGKIKLEDFAGTFASVYNAG
jgi:uncharacterized protein YbjT (DUF2867 family)